MEGGERRGDGNKDSSLVFALAQASTLETCCSRSEHTIEPDGPDRAGVTPARWLREREQEREKEQEKSRFKPVAFGFHRFELSPWHFSSYNSSAETNPAPITPRTPRTPRAPRAPRTPRTPRTGLHPRLEALRAEMRTCEEIRLANSLKGEIEKLQERLANKQECTCPALQMVCTCSPLPGEPGELIVEAEPGELSRLS